MTLTLKYSLAWLWGFLISLIIYPIYTGGDLVTYRHFYSLIEPFDIYSMLALANFFGGFDIVFIIFYWPFSALGFDHYYANSIVNGIFCILLYKMLKNLNTPIGVIFLIFINYYLFVLMIPAERSKVSFIFILLAATSFQRSSYKYIFLSIASHLQSLFIIASYFSSLQVNFVKRLINGYAGTYGLKMGFILFLFALIIMLNFHQLIINKLGSYSLNLVDFVKSLFLSVSALVTSTP